MPGLFALSVDSVYEAAYSVFTHNLFWGTFYQQNLGEERSGLAVFNEGEFKKETQTGLFAPNFRNRFKRFRGTEGIGYCGPSDEPYCINSRLGALHLCFSGNIINLSELAEELMAQGHIFERNDDIEIIAMLVGQGRDIIDGIKIMSKKIKGAYSLLILTEKGIYAVCSPDGHWPLVIGEKEGAVAVASESGAFYNLGFELVRDIEPGEIVLIKGGCWATEDLILADKVQICSFLLVYTLFPNSKINGTPASLVRKRLGAILARQDIERGFIPDIIASVPDSGRSHAIGYLQEFCRQVNEGKISRVPFYDEVLLKFPFAGRSFTSQDKKRRDEKADKKILKSGERFDGKTIVVCDDSIVRGTQTQTNLVPKLRSLGLSEIHLRISNPELFSYCPWGKTTREGELLASRIPSIQERIRFLKVESLEFNTIEDLVGAIGLPKENLCLDCSLPQ